MHMSPNSRRSVNNHLLISEPSSRFHIFLMLLFDKLLLAPIIAQVSVNTKSLLAMKRTSTNTEDIEAIVSSAASCTPVAVLASSTLWYFKMDPKGVQLSSTPLSSHTHAQTWNKRTWNKLVCSSEVYFSCYTFSICKQTCLQRAAFRFSRNSFSARRFPPFSQDNGTKVCGYIFMSACMSHLGPRDHKHRRGD